MRATLWSWREEMSYWNSLIWFRQNVHELKRLQHRYPYLELSFRRLFGDRDLDREKEKSMNSQKKFVLMPWRSLFKVSDSIFTIVIVVSQIDLKICMVLTLNGTVFQVTRNVCWGKVVYHIQSIKKIDSNRLEKGAWLKQSKIDIKSPCRWSRLPFFSSLLFFYPLLQLRKPARHNFDKDNHQATSTRIKRQMMP